MSPPRGLTLDFFSNPSARTVPRRLPLVRQARGSCETKNTNISSTKSGIICWECGGTGHTQAFHQKFLTRQVKAKADDDAGANALIANEDSDQDVGVAEGDDDEGGDE
ncbi:hypothetical protein PR002_g30322 [Phytophthora rubi]|uniref:Uncharacterized protein n=1 Tax=Phytophthora rubi TaxID=129364 RepID=A0A6A3GT08_9STRA|nr:hypothetical protein PR002_g30322 [Phytophthora rubi]